MKFLKRIFSRWVIISLLILIQIAMFCVLLVIASSEYVYVSIFCEVLSIAILLHLIYHDGNPNHRIPWIVVLLILPPAGLLIYLIFGRRYISKKHSRKYQSVKDKQSEFNRQDEEVINKLQGLGLELKREDE